MAAVAAPRAPAVARSVAPVARRPPRRRARGPHLPAALEELGLHVLRRARPCTSAAMGLGLGGLIEENGGVHRRRDLPAVRRARACSPPPSCRPRPPTRCGRSWAGSSGCSHFHAMVATPMTPGRDLRRPARLERRSAWRCRRRSSCVVAAVLGAIASPWAVLAVPAAVLTGLAFSAPLTAVRATQESDIRFPLVMRFIILPLFLFSGTFFPSTDLPEWRADARLDLAAVARRRAVPGGDDGPGLGVGVVLAGPRRGAGWRSPASGSGRRPARSARGWPRDLHRRAPRVAAVATADRTGPPRWAWLVPGEALGASCRCACSSATSWPGGACG